MARRQKTNVEYFRNGEITVTLYDFILSAGPPFLAAALQRWGIPSNKELSRQARSEQERVGLPGVARLIEDNLRGTVAINNIAVTLVSFPSGAFALIHGIHAHIAEDAMYLYILIVALTVVILVMANKISGRSFQEIAIGKFELIYKRGGRHYSNIGPINIINGAIYLVNLGLVALSLILLIKFYGA